MQTKLKNLKKLKISKRLLAIVMVLIIAMSMIPLSALQASAAGVNVTLGDEYKYGSGINWTTHYMESDGVVAYCAEPSMKAPSGNQTNVVSITNANIIKTLYYGYGGAGFNTKLSSINMTMKEYMLKLGSDNWLGASGSQLGYLLTHRAIAYFYGSSDWAYALPQDWRNAVTSIAKAIKAAPAVKNFSAYEIRTGNSTQNVISYYQKGKIELQKVSAKASITNTDFYSLQGAVYDVISNSTNKSVGTITTDKNGKGELDGLVAGSYTVKEKTASKGFTVDAKAYNVTVTGGKTATVKSTETPLYAKLTIVKKSSNPSLIDGNSCYTLAGAKFTVKNNTLGTTQTVTTPESGRIELTNLPFGNYTVTETVAPEGHILPVDGTVSQTFNLSVNTGNYHGTVTFVDPAVNDPVNILLSKVDSTTGKANAKLAGAEFTIKYYDGYYSKESDLQGKTPLKTWVVKTDEDGFARLDPAYIISGDEFYYTEGNPDPIVPLGTLTIQETKAPKGYLINDELFIRQITADNEGKTADVRTYNAPIIEEKPNKAGFSITKVDETSIDFRIENTSFAVFEDAACTKYATTYDGSNRKIDNTFTTADDGIAESGWYATGKTYYIKETVANDNYLISDKVYEVKLTEADAGNLVKIGEKIRVGTTAGGTALYDTRITNTPKNIPGRATVLKYSDDELLLTGAVFGVYADTDFVDYDGNIIYKAGKLITKAPTFGVGAFITIPNVGKGGTIKVVEISAPLGFGVDKDYWVKFNFDPATGLTTDYDGNTYIAGVVSDVSDDADKYLIGQSGAGFINKPISGELSLEKKDDITGKGLKGAKFDVIADENIYAGNYAGSADKILYAKDSLMATIDMTDDTSKTIAFDKIGTGGRVRIVETQAPTGYELATNIVDRTWYMEFDVSTYDENRVVTAHTYDDKTQEKVLKLTVINPRPVGTLEIEKSSEDNILEGHTFKAVGSDGSERTKITDENGKITWKNLPVITTDGKKITYDIYEDNTALRYKDLEPQTVELTANKTTTVKFENILKKGDLKIVKSSEDNIIEGHTFVVKEVNGADKEYTGKTNAKGEIEFKDLPVYNSKNEKITYKLYEDGVAIRYVEPDEQETTLTENKTTTVNFENILKKGNIKINKQSEDGKIENVSFSVKASTEGSEILTGVTNERGITTFIDLPLYDSENEGITYTVYENDVPVKYATPVEQEITLTVDYTTDLTFVNTLKRVSLEINKKSEDGVLEGWKFVVKGSDGSEQEVITNDKGKGEALDLLIYDVNSNLIEYTVYEDDVPVAIIEPEQQVVTLTEDGDNSLEFINIQKKGNLKVTKTSDDGFKENFEFKLAGTSSSGKTIELFEKTNKEGFAEFKDVLIGNYTISEVGTPNRYEVPVPTNATIEWDKVTDVKVHNTLKSVDLGTNARDNETGGHYAYVNEKTELTDTVHLSGLVIGETYVLKGKAMLKSTGLALIQNEQEITSELEFKATAEVMDVDLPAFKLDSTGLLDDSIVIFEKIYLNGVEVGKHEDMEDKGQTVVFLNPTVKTKAQDILTGLNDTYVNTITTLEDTVSLTGLIIGKEYETECIWQDKETSEPLLDANGNLVSNKIKFTAVDTEMEIIVSVELDSSLLKGKDVVAFETLYFENREVAAHTDIEDGDQTVTFKEPKIKTTAKDSVTGTNEAYVSEETVIIDTVEYHGLIIGKEYTVKGVLMNKKTAEPLLVDGEEITSEYKFTAEESDGFVELPFKFNSLALQGEAVVVFERVYYEGIEIATHTDLEDKNQTVTFKEPKIKTTAKDKASGNNTAAPSKETTIIDTVDYHDLIIGKEYVVKGVLMDKSTGKPLLIDGKEVRAEETFTATQADGSIDIKFVFDSSSLKDNQEIVVFEDLYYNGKLIATHTDLNDKGQTITFKITETTANGGHTPSTSGGGTVATGDLNENITTICTIGLIVAAIVIFIISKKKKKNDR